MRKFCQTMLPWFWVNSVLHILTVLILVANLGRAVAIEAQCQATTQDSHGTLQGFINDTVQDCIIQGATSEFQISVSLTPYTGSGARHKAFEIYDGGGSGDQSTLLLRMSAHPYSAATSLYSANVASTRNSIIFRTVPGLILGTPLKVTFWIKECRIEKQEYQRTGVLMSPHYPLMPNEANCASWSIQGDYLSSIITISIHELNLTSYDRNGVQCLMDYLRIGPNPELTYCGRLWTGNPRFYVSRRNHVWIKFRTAGNGRGTGFKLTYIISRKGEEACGPGEFQCSGSGLCILDAWRCNGVSECEDGSDEQSCAHTTARLPTVLPVISTVPVPEAETTVGDWDENGAGCSRVFWGSKGTISSPDYGHGSYPPGADCLYVVVAPAASGHVRLELLRAALGPASYARGNHGDAVLVYDAAVPLAPAVREGRDDVAVLGAVRALLAGDRGAMRLPGIRTEMEREGGVEVEGAEVVKEGTGSQGWMEGGALGLEDEGAEGLEERGAGNQGAGSQGGVVLLARFIDVVDGRRITSHGNAMVIHFVSDSQIEDEGFTARYTTVGCQEEVLTRPRGQIQNTMYPAISLEQTCQNWTILGHGENDTIILSISHIDFPVDSCKENYILIGPSPMRRLCGNHVEPIAYISATERVWIYYYYQGDRAGQGFSLEYIITNKHVGRCASDEFRCYSGGCIKERWRCNGVSECRDGSDEAGCAATTPGGSEDGGVHVVCSSPTTRCLVPDTQRFHCILPSQWCDGIVDCDGGTDEERTDCNADCSASYQGPSGVLQSPRYPARYPSDMQCFYFIHVDITRLIQLRPTDFSLRNMDMLQVYDGADREATLLGQFYESNPFPNLITSSTNRLLLVFDSDSRHDHGFGFNITFQEKGTCLPGQETCGGGEEDCFVSVLDRCDGVWQCQERGGDERGCYHCSHDRFPCGRSASLCYTLDNRCNGMGHCPQSDDENNCTAEMCGPHNGTFLCDNGRCIYESWWCDGAEDCPDGSDEVNCTVLPSVNVITAAVMGSLICGWLVMLALSCARRLHYIRMRGGHRLHHHAAAASLMHFQEELLARRRAPPLYDEAMATSRPYDEVMRQRSQAAQADQGGTGEGEGEGASESRPLIPPPSAESHEEAEGTVVGGGDVSEEEELTMTPNGVQWRRNSNSGRTTRQSLPKELARADSATSSVSTTSKSSDDDSSLCGLSSSSSSSQGTTEESFVEDDDESESTPRHREVNQDTHLHQDAPIRNQDVTHDSHLHRDLPHDSHLHRDIPNNSHLPPDSHLPHNLPHDSHLPHNLPHDSHLPHNLPHDTHLQGDVTQDSNLHRDVTPLTSPSPPMLIATAAQIHRDADEGDDERDKDDVIIDVQTSSESDARLLIP